MKKLALTAILVAGALVTWRFTRTADRPENRLFFNHPWLDHMPRGETDIIHVFVAITEEPLGIFQSGSQWKGEHELFKWEGRGDGKIELFFPQNKSRERLTYKVDRCHAGQFDLCLDVSGSSRGPKRYFSREEWEVGSGSVDVARGVKLPEALRGALTGPSVADRAE